MRSLQTLSLIHRRHRLYVIPLTGCHTCGQDDIVLGEPVRGQGETGRLASGCWPALPGGIRTRRVPTEGFRVVVTTSHSPSPGFAWRNDPCSGFPSAGENGYHAR